MNLLMKLFVILFKIFTLAGTFKGTNCVKGQKLPLWTWNCLEGKYVPTKALQDEKLQSLVTCNMLCTSFQFWPKPTGPATVSTTAVPVRADLFILKILSFPSIPVLEQFTETFELFRQDLRNLENNVSRTEPCRAVEIRVAINENGSDDPRMLLDTDEGYDLQLNSSNLPDLIAEINSNSFCGARHALQTLSQLIWLDPYRNSLLMRDAVKVEDAPRFPYRGLMLDTVQNYFSVNEIIKTIDVMAATKLNTFHWHAADSQGVSINLKSLSLSPYYEFYKQGAMYSPDEVQIVARHARMRGIRVLVEIDLSALMCNPVNWGSEMRYNGPPQNGYEDPVKECNCESFCSDINMNNTQSIYIMEKIYAEIIQITNVEDIFHLGVADSCKYCPLRLNTTSVDLNLKFTHNILQYLEFVKKKIPNLIILWSTNLTDRIKIDLKSFIHRLAIQVCEVPLAKKYIPGIRTIISNEDAWDLTSGYGDWDAKSGANYNSWHRVYEHRPWSRKMTSVGGEATIWSSVLSTGGLRARVWPRVAALGERLWSDPAEGATRLVQARLDVHRSRLYDRGVHTAPLWSMWCTQNVC